MIVTKGMISGIINMLISRSRMEIVVSEMER